MTFIYPSHRFSRAVDTGIAVAFHLTVVVYYISRAAHFVILLLHVLTTYFQGFPKHNFHVSFRAHHLFNFINQGTFDINATLAQNFGVFLWKKISNIQPKCHFQETKRPSKEMQVSIARQLGLQPSTVGNFFMNARRRLHDKWQNCDYDNEQLNGQQNCQASAKLLSETNNNSNTSSTSSSNNPVTGNTIMILDSGNCYSGTAELMQQQNQQQPHDLSFALEAIESIEQPPQACSDSETEAAVVHAAAAAAAAAASAAGVYSLTSLWWWDEICNDTGSITWAHKRNSIYTTIQITDLIIHTFIFWLSYTWMEFLENFR